jgi:hypothetical protein
MNRKANGILTVAVLLTMLGPGLRWGSTSPEAASPRPLQEVPVVGDQGFVPKKKVECAIKAGSYEAEMLGHIQRSLSNGLTSERTDKDQSCPMDQPATAGLTKETIQAVIAVVPDPVHTNLALFFDRQMDALEQAAQDCGWIFDEAVLPWDSKSHLEPSDFRIRDAEKGEHAEKENYPGILIFRRILLSPSPIERSVTSSAYEEKVRRDPCGIVPEIGSSTQGTISSHDQTVPHNLLVFVVSETPTGGIRKTQFRNAVLLLHGLLGPEQPRVMRILGPTFSGSLQSLAELLQNCATSPPRYPCSGEHRVVINSGTVTSRDGVTKFSAVFNDNRDHITFHTLQEYDENAEYLFQKYACRHDYQTARIAVLSEDETAYGNMGPDREPGDGAGGNSNDGKCSSSDVLHLYFPRDISQLRSAYQKAALSDSSSANKVPRSNLPLDLESPSGDEDTVTHYSGKQLPLSQEAVLIGILTELRKHSIEIVLLRATNPLDQLFLSRYLRQAFPQARIVIAGADLLFAREIQDTRLHGVMALTTYMLSPGEEHLFPRAENEPMRTSHSDRVFSGSDAVGTYNAMSLLLVNPPMTLGGQSPQVDQARARFINEHCPKNSVLAHLAQYEWPHLAGPLDSTLLLRPPIHLSVLGHGGFWDVAILDPSILPAPAVNAEAFGPVPLVCDPYQNYSVDPGTSSIQQAIRKWGPKQVNFPLVPNSWKLFKIMVLGFSLTYLIALFSASVLSRSETIAHLAPAIEDSRKTLFAVAGYLHFLLLMIVLWSSFFYVKRTFKEIVFMILAGITLGLLYVVCVVDLQQRKAAKQARWFTIATIFTSLSVIVLWEMGYLNYMFMWRSLNLSSGVSPLLPVLLLLASGLWGVWHTLSGSVFVDQRRPALPKMPENEPNPPDLKRFRAILEDDQKTLLALLRPDHIDLRIVAIAVLVVVAAWELAEVKPVRSLEEPGYEYVLAALVIASLTLLVATSGRLLALWRELKWLLQSLDSSPLRRGFKKLKGFSWSPIWRIGAGGLGDFRRLLSLESEARERVTKFGPEPGEAWGPLGPYATADTTGFLRTAYENCLANWFSKSLHHASAGATAGPLRDNDDRRSSGRKSFTAAMKDLLPVRWITGWVMKTQEQRDLDAELIGQFATAQAGLSQESAWALGFLATEWQQTKQTPDAGGQQSTAAGVLAKLKKALDPAQPEDQRRADRIAAVEEFLARLYTTFILIAIVRLRSLVMAMGGMYIFIILALSSYPFQPQVGIRLSLLALLVLVVGAVGLVYAQMHRDPILSYITDTRPGELGADFWIRFASFVALPLLGLIASQYPEIGGSVNSWIEPALGALK